MVWATSCAASCNECSWLWRVCCTPGNELQSFAPSSFLHLPWCTVEHSTVAGLPSIWARQARHTLASCCHRSGGHSSHFMMALGGWAHRASEKTGIVTMIILCCDSGLVSKIQACMHHCRTFVWSTLGCPWQTREWMSDGSGGSFGS